MIRQYRSGPRRTFTEEVVLELGGGTIPLDAVDLGPGGIFLATEVLPEEGEEFDLVFDLPGRGGQVRVRGSVARVNTSRKHVRSGRALRPGIGLQFKDLPRGTRASLARYAGGVTAA